MDLKDIPKSREKSRIMVMTGPLNKLPEHFVSNHPFVQQLDILFSDCPALEDTLQSLQTTYHNGKAKLYDIIEGVEKFISKYDLLSNFIALSAGSSPSDDTWCIDSRGMLVMALSKETYEELGLVASCKCTSPRLSNKNVVMIDLCNSTLKTIVRVKNAIKLWDERRATVGIGAWDVLQCISNSTGSDALVISQLPLHTASCRLTSIHDIRIPSISLSPYPSWNASNDESQEANADWHDSLSELFEWVGMAALHSPRLNQTDSVDPFVAVYEAPALSKFGNIKHAQIRGLLSPSFVQSTLDACVSQFTTSSPQITTSHDVQNPLLAMTANLHPSSPITYVHSSSSTEGADMNLRLKPPTKAVDCWSLMIAPWTMVQDNPSNLVSKWGWALATVEI